MTESYYGSLVDCALLIGVNEFSNLKLSKSQDNSASNVQENYQQYILAAISSSVAMFPFSKTTTIYPPAEFKKNESITENRNFRSQLSHEEYDAIHDVISGYNITDDRNQFSDPTFVSNLSRRASKYQSRRKSIKAISLDNYKGSLGSVSIETIKAFPGTYFHNNLKISQQYIEPKIEILPMTDSLGNRSYAFRLEFYRNFFTKIITSNDQEHSSEFQLEYVVETDLDSPDSIYLPCNIVFFSKYPYFDLFRDLLTQLFEFVHGKNTKLIENELLEYCAILTRIPIIKTGNLQINFNINNCTYSIKPNNPDFNQIIDWDMSLLFQLLSLDDIIFILTALFQEQKIVFFSKYSNIITVICESLLILFQPFKWKHFYLTVVPTNLYELIDAIFPFIMGLPHCLKERVIRSYNDILFVDLDEGSITTPTDVKIARISKEMVDQLKERLKDRDWLGFRRNFWKINFHSIERSKEILGDINKEFSEKVMRSFMETMVDLFHEGLSNITVEKQNNQLLVANLDKFRINKHSENVDFFNAIYQNEVFSCFLDDKLRKMTVDIWVRICNSRYPNFLHQYKTQTLRSGLSKRKSDIINQEIDECKDLSLNEPYQIIHFPINKTERKNYFSKMIILVNLLRDTITTKKVRAEIYLQMGEPIKALEIVHEIYMNFNEPLDFGKIKQILIGFDEGTKRKLEVKTFYTSLADLLKQSEHSGSDLRIDSPNVTQFVPPNIPIPRNCFLEICKRANITDFESTADDLFQSLTLDPKLNKKIPKLIPLELFQCFYNNWIRSSLELNENDINVEDLLDEVLITLTDPCVKVDDFGQGRLLLTQIRLLFIPFGSKSIKVIIDFTKEVVSKIKTDRKIKGFGKTADFLEITKADCPKKLVIWLSQDIELWHNIICEISVGNRLSIQEKSSIIQEKMTEQCLVFENLASCARTNTYFKKYFQAISKIMLKFSLQQTEYNKSTHKKYLLSTLMPFPKQSVKIDCILYIPDQSTNGFNLWCGLRTENKCFIKIFQNVGLVTQSLNSDELDIQFRIKIMLHITGFDKVAIGCCNGIICLVDSVTYKMEEIDLGNKSSVSLVCGVCYYGTLNSCFIYWGNSNGDLIRCDPYSKNLKKTMTIPNNSSINFIEPHNSGNLIIGSTDYIYITSLTGVIISFTEIHSTKTILNRISFMTMINSERILLIGLAWLPVLIEYEINEGKNLICIRKKNLLANKDYVPKEPSGNLETSSKHIGISSILNVQDITDGEQSWIVYKDGSIEIRNSKTLEKLETFNAHSGAMMCGLIGNLGDKVIVVTAGKDDGKIILWNISPF